MQGNVSCCLFPHLVQTLCKLRFQFLLTYLPAHNIQEEEKQKRNEEHLRRKQTVVSKSSNIAQYRDILLKQVNTVVLGYVIAEM